MANGITRYSLHPEVVQLIFGQSLSKPIPAHELSKILANPNYQGGASAYKNVLIRSSL